MLEGRTSRPASRRRGCQCRSRKYRISLKGKLGIRGSGQNTSPRDADRAKTERIGLKSVADRARIGLGSGSDRARIGHGSGSQRALTGFTSVADRRLIGCGVGHPLMRKQVGLGADNGARRRAQTESWFRTPLNQSGTKPSFQLGARPLLASRLVGTLLAAQTA